RLRAGPAGLVAGLRIAAGLHRRRSDRRCDRTRHHPLSLRPGAGNPACHLGRLARSAAGRAHDLRPEQPRGRKSVLDVGQLRDWPDGHYLEQALDRRLLTRRFRAAAVRLQPHVLGAAHARGHAEPAHGFIHGHPYALGRCLHFRARLGNCRNCRRGAQPGWQCLAQSRAELHHRFLHGRGVRRRRQFVGHLAWRIFARHRQQVPRTLCRSGAGQDHRPGADHPVHPEAPARSVRAQGPGGGSMMSSGLFGGGLDRRILGLLAILIGAAVLVPVLNLAVPPTSSFHIPTYAVALLGKYLCYAMLALSLDLVWGYCGILSLGHGAFFALGGYAMGMYLMRQIGTRGVYGHPVLPDFMVFLNWKELPWYWYGFDQFWFAALMVMLVPGLLAFAFGWLAFRSRVTGVYLSIITQAMTYALLLAFFRNDMGFGGNNGLTDFKDILGFSLQAPTTRAALFSISALMLAIAVIVTAVLVSSKYGKLMIAVRDAESRTRFLGWRPENIKLFAFTVSAVMAGIAGALYVPQVGIINPSEFAPANSIEIVIWTAVGGRGTILGP